MTDQADLGKSKGRGRLVVWVAIVALLIYVGFMLGPYLRSTLVRDAAVTTWINVATSPIFGEVAHTLPKPGDRIGENGVIAQILNTRADRSAYEAALAEEARAGASVAAAAKLVEDLQSSHAGMQRLFAEYQAVYMRELVAELDGVAQRLESEERRRALLESAVARLEADNQVDGSESLQEAGRTLADQEREISDLEVRRRRLRARRQAAFDGTVMLEGGSDPGWGMRAIHQLDAALAKARVDLTEAKATLTAAKANSGAAESAYDNLLRGQVEAPPGAMLWSTIVGEGAAVDIGTPVAAWIDCNVLLVDVPVADAEISLLEAGSPATVIFEGESTKRQAEVLLTRGSAATIEGKDLAALAKGRTRGVAQAILTLDATDDDRRRCPVGYAAYVDFPEIGIIDVLRARLRL